MKIKSCKDCGVILHVDNKVPGRNWCLDCRKKYMRKYNQNPHRLEQRRSVRKHYREQLKVWLASLKDLPCKDCGNKFPSYAMDWHHVGKKSSEAKFGMYRLAFARGKQSVLDEIEKCDLICSNCHRIRTHLSS